VDPLLGHALQHDQPPFAQPDTAKIAIKVMNHYGDEVLKVCRG
jgi:hypothetical protein